MTTQADPHIKKASPGMSVRTLFQTWTALKRMLINPHLSDEDMDRLVDQSTQVIQAMTHTPSTGLMEVQLKLEAYGNEVEAGPCDECDALLESALQDRIAILNRLSHMERLEADLNEHRSAEPQESADQDDIGPVYAAYRGQNPGSPYP
jgi:hypothetical protein